MISSSRLFPSAQGAGTKITLGEGGLCILNTPASSECLLLFSGRQKLTQEISRSPTLCSNERKVITASKNHGPGFLECLV